MCVVPRADPRRDEIQLPAVRCEPVQQRRDAAEVRGLPEERLRPPPGYKDTNVPGIWSRDTLFSHGNHEPGWIVAPGMQGVDVNLFTSGDADAGLVVGTDVGVRTRRRTRREVLAAERRRTRTTSSTRRHRRGTRRAPPPPAPAPGVVPGPPPAAELIGAITCTRAAGPVPPARRGRTVTATKDPSRNEDGDRVESGCVESGCASREARYGTGSQRDGADLLRLAGHRERAACLACAARTGLRPVLRPDSRHVGAEHEQLVRVADVRRHRPQDRTEGLIPTITLSVEPGIRLPANATAKIGQSSLLGTQHVELAPPANPSSEPLRTELPFRSRGHRPTSTVERRRQRRDGARRYPEPRGDLDRGHQPAGPGTPNRSRTFDQFDVLTRELNNQRNDIARAIESTNELFSYVAPEQHHRPPAGGPAC